MFNTTPDLTGLNPAYTVANDMYTVFKTNQTIDFGTPIYLSGLVLTVGGVAMSQTTDWIVLVQDDTSISKMMLLNTAFRSTLIRSIQIISTSYTTPYQIACTYQRLYPTPASILATTPTTPKLLPFDPNATNLANVVTDTYAVNSLSGQNLIVPVSGAFFRDSVSITLPTNPVTTLVAGTDYTIAGCERGKTKNTTNTSGVYRFILLTRPYAGNLSVTYHAYGGEATLSDIGVIYDLVSNIMTYLDGNMFLTPNTIGSNVIVTSIIARIAALEATIMGGRLSSSAVATIFQAALQEWFNALPTTTPTASGVWYNDGGIPSVSQ